MINLSDSLMNNINKKYIYEITDRIINLIETKKSYEITVRLSKATKIVVLKNIEELKQKDLPYITGEYMPKDCDYILIREDKKEIFFLELKSETEKKFKKDAEITASQLLSGMKWLEHLTFCSTSDYVDLSRYKMYFVAINKRTKINQQCIPHLTRKKDGKIVTFWHGQSFNVSEFRGKTR